MRPRLVPLLCWSVLLLPAPMAWAQVSEKMRTQIRESLPKFDPQPAEARSAESTIGTPAPLSDDPLVRLPDFQVLSASAPGHDPDNWLKKEGVQEKALKDFKASMNSLEWALNRWYIPLPFGYSLTPSLQDRADAAYKDKKIATEVSRLSEVIAAVSRLDPTAAKKLARDLDLSRHPGN